MKYFSEVMLLTKQNYPDELRCWLNWYLNVIGFDHIAIFDNESPINVKDIISDYTSDKIDYNLIEGWSNQYKLYNDYIKSSESQYTIALDDDEFLYLGDRYKGNIKTFIESLSANYECYNKFYILWVNMFSPEHKSYRDDLFINTHTCYSYEVCNRIAGSWPEDNGWGKCLINTGNFEYEYLYGRNAHAPKCLNGNDSLLLVYGNEYSPIPYQHIRMNGQSLLNTDAFIAHYQFKSDKDWRLKCTRGRVDTTVNTILNKKHIYNEVQSHSKLFKDCTLVKDKWNEYTREHSN